MSLGTHQVSFILCAAVFCLHACIYTSVVPNTHGGPGRALDLLEWATTRCWEPFAGTSVLNCYAISQALKTFLPRTLVTNFLQVQIPLSSREKSQVNEYPVSSSLAFEIRHSVNVSRRLSACPVPMLKQVPELLYSWRVIRKQTVSDLCAKAGRSSLDKKL